MQLSTRVLPDITNPKLPKFYVLTNLTTAARNVLIYRVTRKYGLKENNLVEELAGPMIFMYRIPTNK